MNIFLWILQIFLALHTIVGAVWKFSNSSQVVPSLSGIPHSVWLLLSVLEILCGLMLILPLFNKRLGKFVSFAAIGIAAEMILFCGIHLISGYLNYGELVYWLVVALLSGVIAYGRRKTLETA